MAPEESKFLNKNAIIQQDDLEIKRVEVPEWDGHVYVRAMSAKERDEFEVGMLAVQVENTTERNLENFRARLCVMTIVNKKGKRMFQSDEVELVGGKLGRAVDRIYAVAQELNGIGKKDVEALTKN